MNEYDDQKMGLYQMNGDMYQTINGIVQENPRNESNQDQSIEEPNYEDFFNVEDQEINLDNVKHNSIDRMSNPTRNIKEEDKLSGGQSMNFDIFGEFKSHDNMDVDESPLFNVEMDQFYDPLLDSKAATHDTESLFNPHTQNPNLPNTLTREPKEELNLAQLIPKVPSQRNFIPHTSSFVSMKQSGEPDTKHFRSDSIESHIHNSDNNYNPAANNANDTSMVTNRGVNINNVNAYYNDLSPLTTTTSLTPSASSVHSTQPSFFSAHQYQTRTSMDHPPSVHRQSLDHFSKNRTSFDSQHSSINQRQRNQASGRYSSFTNSISNYIPFMNDRNQRGSAVSTPSESISPSSPQSTNFMTLPVQETQQPRHLIRSIFKGSNIMNNVNNGTENSGVNDQQSLNNEFNNNDNNINNESESIDNSSEFIMTNPMRNDPEYDDSSMITKAKKTKRSLFTRFKTPVKMEPSDDSSELFRNDEMNTSINANKSHTIKENEENENENENMEPDFLGSTSIPGLSGNDIPSLESIPNTTNGIILESASLDNSNNQIVNLISGNSQFEPDYGALFEKVGKRKNIVNPATYIRGKPRYKNDQSETNSMNGSSNSNPNTEKSSIVNNSGVNHPENSYLLSLHSNESSINPNDIKSEEIDTDSGTSVTSNTNTASSLATASKRILGSKLMSKRKQSLANPNPNPIQNPNPMQNPNPPQTTKIISKGVEVEVDLLSLDLPPTTQIFPTSIINSKSRTRGRKENKEADLVDQTKIYLCNYCSRRFKRQEHLKRHFRSLHTFEKPYNCSICNKKFSRSDNLNQHLKIHKQEEELARQGLSIPDSVKAETQNEIS